MGAGSGSGVLRSDSSCSNDLPLRTALVRKDLAMASPPHATSFALKQRVPGLPVLMETIMITPSK